jgi:hypothetical protein
VRRRKTNLGAIVGGAVGGGVALIAILLVGFCFIRCKRLPTQKHRPIDLLQDQYEGFIPQLYQPESFQVPDSTTMSSYESQSYDPYESIQASTTASLLRSGPDAIAMSSYGRQSYEPHESTEASASTFLLQSNTLDPHGLGVGSSSGLSQTPNSSRVQEQLRPVHSVYHDDAGIVEEGRRIPEIIEFPPAYSNIRNN